jgi:hypothetical protein
MNLKRLASTLEDRREVWIRQLILDKAQDKGQIIYGARAINRQTPKFLNKDTEDYDIQTKKPKKSARELVSELKRINLNATMEKAQHKGTYKVKIDGKTIADYTHLKGKPKTTLLLSNRYYDIKSIKKDLQRTLKKKRAEFRKEKDTDSLGRIESMEKLFNSF